MDLDKIKAMLNDCVEVARVSNCPFDSWQKEFVYDMQNQLDDGVNPTEAQSAKIVECWDAIG